MKLVHDRNNEPPKGGNSKMKNKLAKKDIIFHIFSSFCIFLSVYVYSLLSKLEGAPVTKLLTDVLVIFLLVTLNTTVIILYEIVKQSRRNDTD